MEKKEMNNTVHPVNHNGQHHRPNPNHKRPVKKPKPAKVKKPLDKEKIFNILTFVFAGFAHIAFILIIVWSIQFSGIELSAFIFLYIVLALLLIINDIILFVGSKYKDFIIKCIACGLSVLLLIGGIFGSVIVGKLNNTAGKVIENTGKEQYEVVSAAFVTYDDSNIESLKDLSNKKVGVTKSSSENENTTSVGKNKLEKEGINVTYKEYNTLADTFMGLVAKEVDAAILPGSYQTLLKDNSSFTEPLSKTTVVDSVEEEVKTGESTSYSKDLITEPFTVLLIGYAQESENYGLADSVILCSVNPLTYQVAMVSLARDSYVPICGGGNDKLTHARGQSRACLIQTVEDLMDEKVDFYMEINFQGVVDVVDALGGIIINNPVEFIGQSPSLERGNMTVWVPAAEFRANGEQALAFARERHAFASGDFARQEHQQQVIKAIAEELLNLNDVNKALKVMEAAGKNFTTNFSINQLTSLFNFILKNGKNTGVSTMNQIQIFNTRVTGYSSWHWSESAQLALWIYRLWNGSIKDNKWLIDMVMGKEDVKEQQYKFTYYWYAPYKEEYESPEVYDEQQIHEELPTTVPNLIGMTLEEAQTWANGAGVSLGISYVETSDSTLIGRVKSQSVASGTSLDDCGHYVSIEVYSSSKQPEVPSWCGSGGGTWDSSSSTCWCSDGSSIQEGGTCPVEPTHDCPTGQHWDYTQGKCVDDTPTHEHEYHWVTDVPATCISQGLQHEECSCGAKRSEGTPIEKITCPGGTTCNESTGTCDVDPQPETCPEGQHRDPITGECVPDETPQSSLFGIYKKNAIQIKFSNYKSSIKYNKIRIW